MRKKVFALVGLFLAILIFFSVAFLAGFVTNKRLTSSLDDERLPDYNLLDEAILRLKEDYLGDIDEADLIRGAVRGAVAEIGDPYTKYLDPKQAKEMNEGLSGEFDGVGLYLLQRNGECLVVKAIKDAPADKAGVKKGDVIIKVDDVETKGKLLEEIVSKIKGKKGSSVKLTLKREGIDALVELKMIRSTIKIPNITSEVIDGDIGYLKVEEFNQMVDEDMDDALLDLEAKGARGIILDLRDNPGGILESAVDMASKFISSGVIVTEKNKRGEIKKYEAKGGGDDKIPLVLLVNGGSASASEIVAGAIQDNGRGAIVGEQTFGKASVQSVHKLKDSSTLVITSASYFTSKGRDINKKGITPDHVVALADDGAQDDQLIKAKEIINSMILTKEAA
ncbi:MAG: S41 family peptidase [Actinomycetota bacterium]|nr:S41 family peptidase [Actinomycetota bacterium]